MDDNVKTIYSDEVIAILNDKRVKDLLKNAHQLRSMHGNKQISDIEAVICVLKMYNGKKLWRIMHQKKLKGEEG